MRSDRKCKKSLEKEMLCHMIFEQSMDGIILTEPGDGDKILAVNPAACRMLGWTEEELIGKGKDAILDLQNPALPASLNERVKNHSVKARITYTRRDGTTFTGEVETYSSVDNCGVIRSIDIIRDITGPEQAEDARIESENWYKAVFENSLDGIFITSPDGRILKANPAACFMFGMTEDELIKAGRDGTVHTSDPRFNTVLEERARTGRYRGELNHKRKDGTIFPGEISSTLFKDSHGLTKVVMIIRDISERKKAEEMLRESEIQLMAERAKETERGRLFNVLETLPVAITLLTPDHHIAFANRIFRKKYGELDSRHCYDYYFGLDRPCEFCEAYKVLETGKEHRWEATMPDGSVMDVYDLPFTDVNGSPLVLEMDIDITDRKKAEEKLRESEERYRNIVETSNEGIYLVNEEAVITYANKTMELSGYSREEIIGRPIWDFISEESIPVAKMNFEKRKQGIIDNYELKLVRKDGSFIWGVINAKPCFNKDGKFKGYLAMLADITDRKKAEEKLRESEEKFRNIVETANEGILTTDNENIITYVNNKVIDIIGYSPEEVIGRPIWSFINEKYRPVVKGHLVKRRQGISESYEMELIPKMGPPYGYF